MHFPSWQSVALKYLPLPLSRFSHVQLYVTPQTPPTGLPRPWDSPGKNTGVGCHFLLQCMKVKSESEVAQSCPTLSDPMDCSPPGSSVHGILQARVLGWGAVASYSTPPCFSSPRFARLPLSHLLLQLHRIDQFSKIRSLGRKQKQAMKGTAKRKD